MAISPSLSVLASEAVPLGNTPITLNTTPLTFNATVPTGLPLDLAANGVVTPATEASIINNSIGPIKVVSVTTTSVKDWVLTNYTDDFSTKKVNSKDIALQFNKDNVTAAGSIALTPQNWPTIAGSDSLRLDYQGKLAPQSTGFTAVTAANVSFVLDWDDTPISETDIEDTSNPEYSFTVGDIKTINFSFKNSKSDKVVFTSSNPEVATVELVDNSQLRLVSGIKTAKITAISNGTTTVTGTLEDGTSSSIKVVVTDKAVKGLVVKSSASKTSYIEGENFDATGLVIEAINNNGTSDIITNYTLSNNANLAANQTEVILSYSGHEISLPITVVAKTITSISVTTQPSKTNYIEGNSFDSTGMIVKANYDNGTSETITGYTLSNNTNLAKGQTNVVISYASKTVNVPITVVAKTLSNITIATQPTKTNYIEGNDFETTGMVVKANYNNGTSEVITNYTLSNNTNLTKGQTNVTVSYSGKTVNVPITVVAKSVSSLAIEIQPTKTNYIEGNSFDSTGMVVKANYNNGTSEVVNNYTLSNNTNLTKGQTNVTVSYANKTVNVPITVVAKNISSLTIVTQPTKTVYIEGNSFDSTGMIVKANYNNGTFEAITGYTLSNNINLVKGQTNVVVSYANKTVNVPITVVAKTLTSISITAQPTKTNYIEGNNFETTGMVVKATYNNGTSEIITNYTLSNNTNLVKGQTNVVVSYANKTVNVPITVVAKTLTSISVTTQPSKTNYIEGNNFETTGMVVKANYNNGTSEVINNYTLNNNTNLVKGQTNVTVSYAGKTVNMPITVVAKTLSNITVATQPTKTVYSQRSAFDATGLKLRVNYNNNTSMDIGSGWTITNGTGLVAGQTSVTVNYGGKSVNVPITVDKYVLATDADFSGTVNSTDFRTLLKYIGTDKFVEVPHVIKGVPVTSYDNMFKNTSVEGVKSTNTNVTNMEGMFKNSKATTLDLSSFDTSKVTDMSAMFQESQATTLDVSNFDTSNVTDMGFMFNYSKATTLDVSNFDTSNVTTMSLMFNGSQATTLDVSNFDTSNVTYMDSMFASSQATTLDLSSFDTSKVTYMESMFEESKATTLDLSSFDTSNVTNMNRMFMDSKATTGYARTQTDADNFNTSAYKPETLTFRVK